MNQVGLLFLCVMALWAVSVVSVDLSTSKIPNAKIALGLKLLLAGLAAQVFTSLLGHAGSGFYAWDFYPRYFQHLLWAGGAGLLLWYAEIWPAGDAKFFMVLAGALPLVSARLYAFPGGLFISQLVNIFVLAALFAVVGYAVSGMRQVSPGDFVAKVWADTAARLASLSAGRSRLQLLAYPAVLLLIFLLQQLFAQEARHGLAVLFGRVDIVYFFLFLLWDKLGWLFKGRRWSLLAVCCCLLYLAAGWFFFRERLAGMLLASAANVFKFSLLLFFGRFLLEFLMEKKDLLSVSARDLRPGMVLSAEAREKLRGDPDLAAEFADAYRDGLTPEQAELVREWLRSLPQEEGKVEIVQGRPFGHWIAWGSALTLVSARNLAQWMTR